MDFRKTRPLDRQLPADRIFISEPDASKRIAQSVERALNDLWKPWHDGLVVLAIGTDRSTGDSLGPLVGTGLESYSSALGFSVWGTLDRPTHANNLEETVTRIRSEHEKPFIVALDACLGKIENIGSVTVAPGSLRPGAGVNKELPEVGDLHITGTVNVGGFMEYFVLQNTRLSLVINMADQIVVALRIAFKNADLNGRLYPTLRITGD